MPSKDKVILSVTQLNNQVKYRLENQFQHVWVEGEISSPRKYGSGHIYLTLKDNQSELSSVLFAGKQRNLNFTPEHGQKVLAVGSLSLYLPRGQYQFIIEHLYPTGFGELWVAYEQLKQKLQSEGLFELEHKKQIPRFPNKVGVITSAQGAVVRDIINVLGRRAPQVQIIVRPALVQGASASTDLANAISDVNEYSDADLIIIGRGGGSLEDLWCFNDEQVARAIFSSRLPIISAVGHETDFTISDFVADLRAPTPSAAAELCAPARSDILQMLDDAYCRMTEIVLRDIKHSMEKVDAVERQHGFHHPIRQLDKHKDLLDHFAVRLTKAWQEHSMRFRDKLDNQNNRIQESRPDKSIQQYSNALNQYHQTLTNSIDQTVRTASQQMRNYEKLLFTLNPNEVLNRGYTFVESNMGDIITDPKTVQMNDQILIKFAKGKLGAKVNQIINESKNEKE